LPVGPGLWIPNIDQTLNSLNTSSILIDQTPTRFINFESEKVLFHLSPSFPILSHPFPSFLDDHGEAAIGVVSSSLPFGLGPKGIKSWMMRAKAGDGRSVQKGDGTQPKTLPHQVPFFLPR